MARRPNSVPTYRLHKPSGQAIVTLRDAAGNRHDHYLGAYNSKESRTEYARILQELATSPIPSTVGAPTGSSSITVSQLLLAFLKHADRHYRRPDGTLTSEIHGFKQAARVTRDLYGKTLVREFSPLSLKAIRLRLLEKKLCRRTINGRIGRIRHVFKWGMGEALVPPEVFTALTAVTGLQRGRSSAHDPEPIGPVEANRVAATLPFVRPPVKGMIEVQLLTGMRPQDVVRIRPCDIDMSGEVWVYRPPQHKNTHRGKARVVAIGPKAQAILTAFLPSEPSDYFFSPARSVESLLAERAANRKTPRWKSHMERNESKRAKARSRPVGRCYTTHGYAVAVSRGCERAFPPQPPLAQRPDETRKAWQARLMVGQRVELKAWQDANHWHPNQLRHTHGTEVRKRFGLEAAQVVLGHERADVTQLYAEKNVALAVSVASAMG